jgi:hypothetical protein
MQLGREVSANRLTADESNEILENLIKFSKGYPYLKGQI